MCRGLLVPGNGVNQMVEIKLGGIDLVVVVEPGKGVFAVAITEDKKLGGVILETLCPYAHGKYPPGSENIDEEDIDPRAPKVGFAFCNTTQVDTLIAALVKLKHEMVMAGIPESGRVEDDTDE